MAFAEFYCNSLGSNLNAGGISNAAEPGPNARYTSTNGNWSSTLNNFRPTDGTNPTGSVSVGDFASIYNDGATTAVYIARITAVDNKANGNISVSATSAYGSAPVTSATGRSIKVGGAWLGPNGASIFPWGLAGSIGLLTDASSNPVRLNLKNDQTYSLTVAMNLGSLGTATLQGYSAVPGDLGKSVMTSNITTGTNFTCTGGNSQNFVDLIFVNTGASGGNILVSTGVTSFWLRCVFHGGRASGFVGSAGNLVHVIECEAYDNNKNNTAGQAGFAGSGSAANMVCINCYSHDNAGSNSHGFSVSGAASLVLVNCISESNGGTGALWAGAGSASMVSVNSDYYNNGSDGVKFTNGSVGNWAYIVNSNFVKNGGKGINCTLSSQPGIIYKNGRGSGSQANGSSDTLGAIIDSGTDVSYPSGLTPWNAPTTGDFSIILAASAGAGRSIFTQTDGTNSGTNSYRDIGSAQHRDFQKSSTFGG